MLLFYLAYFASLLETSDVKENPRDCNRTRRKKKGCDCLKRWCKDIENLTLSLPRTTPLTSKIVSR